MKPTLQTVADHVGVSRSTVSNAYSRPDQLSPRLRERILSAATELDYPGPNPTARSLRRGRAGAIGVLLTEDLSYAFVDPYAVQFLRGLAEAAAHRDTGLLLVPLSFGDRDNVESKVHSAAVDGFCVFCVPEWHDALPVVASRGLPVVTTEYRADAPESDSFVGIDEYAAARTAAAHLVAAGHRRFAVLPVLSRLDNIAAAGGPIQIDDLESLRDFESRERIRGIRDALAEAGISWNSVTVSNAVTNSRAEGIAAAAPVLDRHDHPTAIVATTDLLALGVLDALASRGLRAGRDVSVTGFDDIPEAGDAGLTTVRQPSIDKGVIAGRLLLDPPDQASQRQILLPTELIVRATTGPVEGN